MVFGSDVLETGSEEIDVAGFFGMDWSVESAEFVFKESPKPE
jgi:hypothetical protein